MSIFYIICYLLLGREVAQGVPGPTDFCQNLDEVSIHGKLFIVRKGSARNCLNSVESCALESAARAHPKMSILVEDHSSLCPTVNLLQQHYPNILMNKRSDSELDSATKLLEKCTKRLKRQGGICLSSHILTLRSLQCLRNVLGHNNPIGTESVIQNEIMIFDSNHPFLDHIIGSYLNDEYYFPNGLTKAFKSFCNYSENIFPLSQDFSCSEDSSIALVTSEFLHPYTILDAADNDFFFGPKDDHIKLEEMLARLESSFTVNFYKTLDSSSISSKSFFAHLAQFYCPLVYSTMFN